MDRRDVNYYEAHAQTVILKDITSDEYNAEILQKLRDNDPKFTCLGIKVEYPDDASDFLIQSQDDLGWLGYFVGTNKTLQYLYIDMNGAPDFLSMFDRIGVFIEGLNRNQSIEQLYIGSDLGSKNFRRMNHFFLHNNNLRELEFGAMNNIGVDSARSIAYMISQCASLTKISFEDSEASDIVLAEITTAISTHPQLEELDLSGNNLGRQGCVALTSALKACRNPQLQSLFLSYNAIDDNGVQALVSGIRNCHNLTKLSLGGNELITAEGCRSLSTLFQSDHCKLNLTQLYLDEISIGDDGALAISAGLANLHSLEELHLSYNAIGNEGAGALVAGLMDLQSLKKLDLSHNSIGGQDLRSDSVVQEPNEISILERLDLMGNAFSVSGLISLGNLLQGTRTLRELNLCNCAIDDEGLQALAESISNCCNLTRLYLSSNRSITATGLTSLSSFVHSDECCLQHLCLDEINFGDDGALALANGLKGNNTLKSLYFRPASAGLTSVGWSAFSKLLCATTSINNTYLSNHTLETVGNLWYESTPDDIKQLLELNKKYTNDHVAIRKIIQSHRDFDVESMLQWKLKLLPLVVSWFDRVSALVDDKSWVEIAKIVYESNQWIEGRKLLTMYKFVRGLPLLVVDGYSSSKTAVSRKRKFDQ
jgi:Ran GTPase-activating protein (RanGAP) involved in mRNA processing and transport